MAEIYPFPSKDPTEPANDEQREQVIAEFAAKLAGHMASAFYRKGIMDIPVQFYIHDLMLLMTADHFDYNEDTLNFILNDPSIMKGVENKFIATLIEKGWLSEEYR